MFEVKAGKFNKKGASRGIWVDVEDWLLLPGIHKITEIDGLSGRKKIVGDVEITQDKVKHHIKIIMNILKTQYESVMEIGAFKELEINGLIQHKGFEYEVKE